MPFRKTLLANDEYYHVFNRGVAKMPICNTERDYSRLLRTISYYRYLDIKNKFSETTRANPLATHSGKMVDIVAYCLMPNHFHLLLRQNTDHGISTFMKNISISYAKYFNTKNKRVGPLFQGQFKAVHIEKDEQLLHVSRYIHLNPIVGFLVKTIDNYKWSSFHEYSSGNVFALCDKEVILNRFSGRSTYKQFVMDQIDYAKKLAYMKHLFIDEDS